ncbi:MAG: hypothetical protein KC621_02965 [Myxococcales bacterium]|nr:hypothetical protein [Myxococcales bacterium]
MSSRAIHTIETRPNHRPVAMWEAALLDEPSIELLPLDDEEANETLEQALLVSAVTLVAATGLTVLSGMLGFLLGVLVAS